MNAELFKWPGVWFGFLWILWAALLFGGFIFGKPDAARERRMPTWTRMASSLTLVVAGWSWWLLAQGSAVATFAFLIALGMTFGLLGDLFMARLMPVAQPVLGGIAAFGLGHVAYIAAGWIFGVQQGLVWDWSRLAAWGIWLLVGLAGWFFAVFRGSKSSVSSLVWAALPYALLLASTAGVATGLALHRPQLSWLAIGAALFLASDLILAARLFSQRRFYLVDDVIWFTYGPGQMLIVFSVGSALR